MSKKAHAGIHVGASSILVVFVLLCLTTFATLSLVSANADEKLARQTALSVTRYYAADAKAQELLALADEALLAAHNACKNESDYFARCKELLLAAVPQGTLAQGEDGFTFSYLVPLDDSRNLQVALALPFSTQNGRFFEIMLWRTAPANEWVPDDSLPLWNDQTNIFVAEP